MVIEKAQRETRFRARAARIDSTVVKAGHPLPSDAMLALQGARTLAREGRKLSRMIGATTGRVRDRSRTIGKTVRAISKTLARRTGEAKAAVMALNQQAGQLIARSAREAKRLAAAARACARGRGAKAKLQSAEKLQELADRCGKVAEQIDRRVPRAEDHHQAGVNRRPRRPTDPQRQARQTDRVRVRGADLRGDREHPQGRPRVHPPRRAPAREPRREHAVTAHRRRARTRWDLSTGDRRRRRLQPGPTKEAFPDLGDEQIQISGRHEPGSRRTRKRRARYRTGIEGRISHLKRGYGMRRSRLKGDDGMQIWTGWAILAYDLDTLAIPTH